MPSGLVPRTLFWSYVWAFLEHRGGDQGGTWYGTTALRNPKGTSRKARLENPERLLKVGHDAPLYVLLALGGPNGLLPLAHQNRAVTESFGKSKFLGRNISVICPGSCGVTEIQITSWPSKKELFTSHFCDLYRSCAVSRKSFLRLHFFFV